MKNYFDLIPITEYKKGCVNTFTGVVIDLKNPRPEDFNLEDIKHHLGNVCRFGGFGKRFTVLQHSILVADLAPEVFKKEALFHDAAEAYLGDVIKPLKHILGSRYKRIERRFMRAIFERFGLNLDKLQWVKQFDDMALELEWDYVMKGKGQRLKNAVDLWGTYFAWHPDLAPNSFDLLIDHLFNGVKHFSESHKPHFPFLTNADGNPIWESI